MLGAGDWEDPLPEELFGDDVVLAGASSNGSEYCSSPDWANAAGAPQARADATIVAVTLLARCPIATSVRRLRGVWFRLLILPTLAVPAVFAFADGGSSATARPAFLVAAFALLGIAAAATNGPLIPASREGRAALSALAALATLTAASRAWSPDPGGWLVATQLASGYFALLWAASIQLVANRPSRALVEPALAAGTLVVVAYGLVTRALSDWFPVEQIARAGGRLTAPTGYWNAQALLAALGIVLCASIATGRSSPRGLRAAATAAAPVLGAGLMLTYSRTGIAAALAGMILLGITGGSSAASVRRLVPIVAAALAGVALTLPFAGVRDGPTAAADGGLWLSLLVIAACAAGSAGAAIRPRPLTGRSRALHRILVAGLVVTLALPFAAALIDRTDDGRESFGATSGRLASTGSNRAQYWHVAVEAFAQRPAAGHGAGSFASLWLRERTIDEKVINAHSLWLETAAELGLAGLALVLAFAVGVALALRRGGQALHGASAALLAWLVGASLDWHWQIPAVTANAVIMAALAISAERPSASAD